jgi:hypothetical protein
MTKTYDPKSVKISIRDPVTGEEKLVGLVKDIKYGLSYDQMPTYVLGRSSGPRIFINGEEQP